MRQISVLLTKYSDWISTLVYYIGGRGFTTAPSRWRRTKRPITALTIGDSRLKL